MTHRWLEPVGHSFAPPVHHNGAHRPFGWPPGSPRLPFGGRARRRQPASSHSRYLRSIVDRVRPAVEDLLAGPHGDEPEALLREAVLANVRASVQLLRHGSELLERLIETDGLVVVGAEYSLATGVVDFFDGVP